MSSLGIFDKKTKTYKKVAGTAEAAAIDDALSPTSTNPVQNKVVKDALDHKLKGYTIKYTVPANTGGWHKIAQTTGNYFNFDLYTNGNWKAQPKSNAHFQIQNTNGNVRIVQLSGLILGNVNEGISKLRMIRVTDNKDIWILEEYSPSSNNPEIFRFTIAGDVTVTPLDGSVDTTTDFKDSVSFDVSDIPTGTVITTGNIDSHLTDLKYGEVAGGKNLFKGDFIEKVLEKGINYTDIDLSKEKNPIKNIEGITFVVFGAYLKKGTYTFSYTNNAYFSLNRIAIAGTNCIPATKSIRKSYTWTQNTDGWTYFGIEGDDSETGVTDTPFSITPDIQIEEGTQATSYEPYIPSVKMLSEGVNKTVVDSAMSDTSTNPVQNKVVKSYVDGKLATPRNIALTGAVTGNANFDGSGNVSIATSVNHTHNYAGSSSAGGSANSAVKLDTATAGSETQPVYFSGGKPVACSYTLNKSVPSNAVFTDTKVTNTLNKHLKAYVTGTTSDSTNTGGQIFDTGVYLGAGTGQLFLEGSSGDYYSTNASILNVKIPPSHNNTLYGINLVPYMNDRTDYVTGLNIDCGTSTGPGMTGIAVTCRENTYEPTVYINRSGGTNSYALKVPNGKSYIATIYSDSSTITISDREKKTDIQSISDKYEELFFKLQPRLFKFKDGTSGRIHIGAIAQEVEESLKDVGLSDTEFAGFVRQEKEYVVNEETGEITQEEGYDYYLRYEEFVMLLCHMLQKLYAEKEEQDNKISDLESRIVALESKLG